MVGLSALAIEVLSIGILLFSSFFLFGLREAFFYVFELDLVIDRVNSCLSILELLVQSQLLSILYSLLCVLDLHSAVGGAPILLWLKLHTLKSNDLLVDANRSVIHNGLPFTIKALHNIRSVFQVHITDSLIFHGRLVVFRQSIFLEVVAI